MGCSSSKYEIQGDLDQQKRREDPESIEDSESGSDNETFEEQLHIAAIAVDWEQFLNSKQCPKQLLRSLKRSFRSPKQPFRSSKQPFQSPKNTRFEFHNFSQSSG